MDTPPAGHPLDAPSTTPNERTYAMVIHLLLLAGHVVPVVPSLVMWLVKRDQSAFIDDHGKESVNFQISIVLYMLVGGITAAFCIGIVIICVAYVLAIVGMIMASVAAHGGRYYRYPMCIRLIR